MSLSSPDLPGDLAGWLSHLERRHPRGEAGIELGLERVAQVRDVLGQRPFCPVITVGGTNGKGSTVAYLEAMLGRAAYRVGAYTSPHLLAYNERVRVAGRPADDAALCAAFAEVERARLAAGDVPLTYFEFGTLAAWQLFAAAACEVLVLEVGLGGRLDAVNAYDADLAIVTTVDLDHCDWLGADREAIGFEKAGIFRPGRPALCGDPEPPAALVAHAAAIGAPLFCMGRDFGFQNTPDERQQWRYWQKNARGELVRRSFAHPGLRGVAQPGNATLAMAALAVLADRLPVGMQAIREGLLTADLPGRFQVLPGRPAIVLDVGHNPQAMRILAANLAGMGFHARTFAVLGMLADKDVAGSLTALAGRIDHWFLADLPGPRGLSGAALAAHLARVAPGAAASLHADPAVALAAAREVAGEDDRIVVFGSFLTVAAALRALGRAGRS